MKNKAITLLVEVAIGITLATAAILYAAFGPFTWMPQRKYWTFALVTSAVFGISAMEFWEYWIRPAFWIWFVGLLGVHISCYSIVLVRIRDFPPHFGLVAIPLQCVLIFSILRKTVKGKPQGAPTIRKR